MLGLINLIGATSRSQLNNCIAKLLQSYIIGLLELLVQIVQFGIPAKCFFQRTVKGILKLDDVFKGDAPLSVLPAVDKSWPQRIALMVGAKE